MNCPECGQSVTAEDHFCPKCYAKIEPPSWWKKILGWLQPKAGVEAFLGKNVTILKTTRIVTNKDGERHEYKSLEELPPEQRAEIERLMKEALTGKSSRVYKVRDASGQEHTYDSPDQLPPEIRALLQRGQGGADPKQ